MNGAYASAERAARESYGKLLAYLARRSGDVDAAQDALAEAFATALTDWPRHGVPASPEAWLLVAARRRILDGVRQRQRTNALLDRLGAAADEATAEATGGTFADERLQMLFACAHPAIPASVRAPLILQTVLGLDAARIAAAFLVAPAAMSQRLVRAKRKIAAARIPLRVPDDDELPARLDTVLDAIYGAFGQSWSDPVDGRASNLAEEAIWLARVVAAAVPERGEALGLLALMLYVHARRDARRDAGGAYVPLHAQDIARWDGRAIAEAEALLRRALTLAAPGRFQLEAAIQSAHAARRHGHGPDYAAIVTLYDALLAVTGSPVVAVNRAVALAEAGNLAASRAALEALGHDERLRDFQPYWAARADAWARAGDPAADEAYARAIGLAVDPAVRAYLSARRAALVSPAVTTPH